MRQQQDDASEQRGPPEVHESTHVLLMHGEPRVLLIQVTLD